VTKPDSVRDGDDQLTGGAGDDTASYAAAGSGVTVSLAIAGPQDTGGAGAEPLIGIERCAMPSCW
jgi:large repetitive protein